MFAPLGSRANTPNGGECAPGACDSRARRVARPLGSVAPLALALLVVWTYLFLGVHELQHVGQADESHCPLAPLAATLCGGGAPPAPLALVPPAVPVQIDLPAIAVRPSVAVRFAPNARAPPLLA